MNQKPLQILLIEDDRDYIDIIRMCLDEPDSMGLKFQIESADRLELGLKLLTSCPFDAVLLDLRLPDSEGLETIQQVLAERSDIPVLVLTNLGDEGLAFEAMRLGAQDFMVKATSDSRLLKRSIWYAIERQKLRRQSEALIRKSPEGMVVIDGEKRVRFVNAAAEAILGRSRHELVGSDFPLDEQQKQQRVAERLIELQFTEIQWDGESARLATLRDITELQRLEQLRAEVRERRRMDQLKDELIGTVSHELRTPLTIVKGAIDNLHEGIVGALKGRQAEIVELAHRNIDRLAKMINNLLDLSRLESGAANAIRRPVGAGPLLLDVAEGFRFPSERRNLDFRCEIPKDLPRVNVDSEMIGQVITNLLDNAIRYARKTVLVRAAPADGGVRVEISDDGPGIPADKLGDLFNKFVQVNRARGGSGYKGTGLGLAICKQIMELHGGSIALESTVGIGTRFSFLLPYSGAEDEARAAVGPRSERG